ncbi:MAG TPA: WecB/TagA/CpsF family glycosyltransferase [Candidatus Binatia bacterium]|nr:WecB/TagA/CpsF family glycosyltransferase [Candidatus Binatia bacterium]
MSGAASATGATADDPRSVEVTTILGVPFALLSFEQAAGCIETILHRPGPTMHVVLANAHTLNLATEDAGYRDVLAQADIVLRDGVGVELAARLTGARPGHNFVGTDFVPTLLRVLGARVEGVSVHLLGGRDGVALEAAHVLLRQIPGLRVVGVESGFGDLDGAVPRIRAASPDVLLVALGNPLQEQWINRHRDELGTPVAIGVGALFDYLAGRVSRAPRWVLRLRSEWLFRLIIEPRRLWRRYVVGNPRFLVRVLRDLWRGRA